MDAVIGFGPGDGALAHTVDECVEVEELEKGMRAYRALAVGLTARARS